MYWLHHVGKTYWTPAQFRKECKEYGVSRRIAVNALSNMEFGDTVLLAMWDGKKSIIFGQFKLDTVYFQNPQTLTLATGGPVVEEVINSFVSRGCGQYSIVSQTIVTVPLESVVEAAKAAGDQLMIGGAWEDVRPRYVLKKVPHRLGFRAFDFDLVQMESDQKRNAKGEPVLYGQYYLNHDRVRVMEILANGFNTRMVRIAAYTRKDDKDA